MSDYDNCLKETPNLYGGTMPEKGSYGDPVYRYHRYYPQEPLPEQVNHRGNSAWLHNSRYYNGIEMGDAQVMKGDKLVLRGLKFHGFHGVKPEEKTLGQKFVVDVDAWMDLREAGKSDNLSDTISYTAIYRIVKEVVEGTPRNLLECVAHQIASITFSNFSQISAVRVEIKKPHVAVHGQIDYLGVEIFRSRPVDGQS